MPTAVAARRKKMTEKECDPWIAAPDKLLVLLAGQSNMAGRGYAGPDDLTVIAKRKPGRMP